jgi:hypothetical protein
VIRSGIRIGQTSMGQSYAIQIQSSIGDWSAAVASIPHGQTDSMD